MTDVCTYMYMVCVVCVMCMFMCMSIDACIDSETHSLDSGLGTSWSMKANMDGDGDGKMIFEYYCLLSQVQRVPSIPQALEPHCMLLPNS